MISIDSSANIKFDNNITISETLTTQTGTGSGGEVLVSQGSGNPPAWTNTLTNTTLNNGVLNNTRTTGTDFTINSPLLLGGDPGISGQILQSNANSPSRWIDAPTSLTGFGFTVTVGTYPGQSTIPQLKANENNNVHVFYADRAGGAFGSQTDYICEFIWRLISVSIWGRG